MKGEGPRKRGKDPPHVRDGRGSSGCPQGLHRNLCRNLHRRPDIRRVDVVRDKVYEPVCYDIVCDEVHESLLKLAYRMARRWEGEGTDTHFLTKTLRNKPLSEFWSVSFVAMEGRRLHLPHRFYLPDPEALAMHRAALCLS